VVFDVRVDYFGDDYGDLDFVFLFLLLEFLFFD